MKAIAPATGKEFTLYAPEEADDIDVRLVPQTGHAEITADLHDDGEEVTITLSRCQVEELAKAMGIV